MALINQKFIELINKYKNDINDLKEIDYELFSDSFPLKTFNYWTIIINNKDYCDFINYKLNNCLRYIFEAYYKITNITELRLCINKPLHLNKLKEIFINNVSEFCMERLYNYQNEILISNDLDNINYDSITELKTIFKDLEKNCINDISNFNNINLDLLNEFSIKTLQYWKNATKNKSIYISYINSEYNYCLQSIFKLYVNIIGYHNEQDLINLFICMTEDYYLSYYYSFNDIFFDDDDE